MPGIASIKTGQVKPTQNQNIFVSFFNKTKHSNIIDVSRHCDIFSLSFTLAIWFFIKKKKIYFEFILVFVIDPGILALKFIAGLSIKCFHVMLENLLKSHGKEIKLVGMNLLERIITKKTKLSLYRFHGCLVYFEQNYQTNTRAVFTWRRSSYCPGRDI